MAFIGLAFGLYVMVTIGIYHVLVVKVEGRFGVGMWKAFCAVGILCLLVSLFAKETSHSMFWGYNAFINFWSIREMHEQPVRRRRKEAAERGMREMKEEI